MNIKSIELIACAIPFRFSYGHALATHREVKSVLCIMYDSDGLYGVGESVPRECYFQAKSVEVYQSGGQPVHIDAEPFGTTPVTITICPSLLAIAGKK